MIQILDTLDFLTNIEERKGENVLVGGPMSCGKSFYVARTYDQIKEQAQRKVLAVKNDIDPNGNPDAIISKGLNHDLIISTPAVQIKIASPEMLIGIVRNYIKEHRRLDALVFDEFQFYKDSIIPVLKRLRRENKDLYFLIFGVDLTFRGEPFGVYGWAQANLCDHLIKLTSKCKFLNDRGEQCSRTARNTVRLIQDNDDVCSGNFDYVSRFFDPHGKLIEGHFRYAPFLDPTVVTNKIDQAETEKGRIYVPACQHHFKVPYADETLKLHQYILDTFVKGEKTSLNRIITSMKDVPHIHEILQFLTEERGVYFDGENFSLEQRFRGPHSGQYFGKLRTGNQGVYIAKK